MFWKIVFLGCDVTSTAPEKRVGLRELMPIAVCGVVRRD